MLEYDEPSMNDIVEAILSATENDPYLIDGFAHMWADANILCIKINKIFSVDLANYVLKSFYKTGRLKTLYILRIVEVNDKVLLIKLEGYESKCYVYSVGDLIMLHLSSYKVQESSATFNDFLGVC